MSQISQQFPPNSQYPLLPGVRSRFVQTSRLRVHVYESGDPSSPCLVLIHGNAASARFFEELMTKLPNLYIVAPDLRGYGASEAKPADATKGLRDYSDDVAATLEALGIRRHHLLGWSLGGNIAMQYTIDHPNAVKSLLLESTGSPFGYGGTHGENGQPNFPDFSGSGGGLIAKDVIDCYIAKDSSADSMFAPRSVMRSTYVNAATYTFNPQREDVYVEQMLMMVIGEQFYPGDGVPSANWPMSAPGKWGSNNALSPKYCNVTALETIAPKPEIVWIHGANDLVVSDTAAVDPCFLGKLGVIPGWPGDDLCPPQPMLSQIRAMLQRYAANGGVFSEVVFENCGHSPHIEQENAFIQRLQTLVAAQESADPQRKGIFDIFRRKR